MLINGVAMNQKFPKTFSIPSGTVIQQIQIEDSVKIGISGTGGSNAGGERFWVTVKDYDAERKFFLGVVDNDLICVSDYKCGDEICFMRNHILSVFLDSEVEEPPLYKSDPMTRS